MCAATTLCAKYNDIDSVKEIFAANKGEIAGVILEPVVGNSGFIAPTQEFLEVGMQSLHARIEPDSVPSGETYALNPVAAKGCTPPCT